MTKIESLKEKEEKIIGKLKQLHDMRARGEKVKPHGRFINLLTKLELIRYKIKQLTDDEGY